MFVTNGLHCVINLLQFFHDATCQTLIRLRKDFVTSPGLCCGEALTVVCDSGILGHNTCTTYKCFTKYSKKCTSYKCMTKYSSS